MKLPINRLWTVAAAAALALAIAPAATASEWNERTTLKFTEPVMVPGTTLQPGTYVFRLVSSPSDRHIVQVLSGDESKVLTTTLTVPVKREDAKGDTVLRLNPTESGTPAIKAWFYPGTLYGHQFLYSDEEAKDIAQRTKTVVLSRDLSDSNMEAGTIFVYDPAGSRQAWSGDASAAGDFRKWQQSQAATARVTSPAVKPSESAAPMYAAGAAGEKVTVDQLEDDATRFVGKTISVDAEVESVLGPRLFTIDERNWIDLEGELLVYMPTDLVALVKAGDLVTVTATPKTFNGDELKNEWGWMKLDEETEEKLGKKPILVASRVTGGTSNVAMTIKAPAGETVGTSGMAGSSAAVTSAATLASGSSSLIGRHVKLTSENVTDNAKDGGFWIMASGKRVYVRPASGNAEVTKGQPVTIEGIVLQLPRAMRTSLQPTGDWNDTLYVYATNIER